MQYKIFNRQTLGKRTYVRRCAGRRTSAPRFQSTWAVLMAVCMGSVLPTSSKRQIQMPSCGFVAISSKATCFYSTDPPCTFYNLSTNQSKADLVIWSRQMLDYTLADKRIVALIFSFPPRMSHSTDLWKALCVPSEDIQHVHINSPYSAQSWWKFLLILQSKQNLLSIPLTNYYHPFSF